ncbi:ZIP family metal transporter [Demequina lutea]|uniref:Zinc transporter 1/2/3 n=1 Tax=Demequina lutea TaxID=431489 RepID=A0A7Y9ZAM1_9MICO|nr:ZIP family metal transporter [Demequina lutea]NYI41285.1 zinc transporter 1/2/3 [Demequina lutea]
MTSDDLFWIKIAFAGAVAVVGLASTYVPWVLGRRASSERMLGLSNTFAAGVLGGAGVIHLLGAGIGAFHTALPTFAYPLALLLAGVGFLFILLIEDVIVPGHPGHDASPPQENSAAVQHEMDWHPAGQGSAIYPVILLIVLSVHSVILGLALGAQSALSGALIVFLAILAHKGAAGLALGVGFQRAGLTHRQALGRLTFFSVMTPLGIIAGAAIGGMLTGRADTLFEAVFDSIGAGTFMYIAALDIIKTEFDHHRDHAQKWLAAAAGFGIMALLAIWI